MRNLQVCVRRAHLEIADRVVAAHAAGLSSLVSDERDLGVTLIDMGAGTTSIAVFYEGHLVHVDSIPVGGEHVTRDIARGLSTPVAHAERMKTQIGRAVIKPNDEYDIIDVPLIGEEDSHAAQPHPTVDPRRHHSPARRGRRSNWCAAASKRVVWIIGRRTRGPGRRRVPARRRARSRCRHSQQEGPYRRAAQARGACRFHRWPAFSAAAGLLTFGLHNHAVVQNQPASNEAPASRIGRIGSWIRDNF